MTNQQLLNKHHQLEKWKATDNVLYDLLHSKIREFYNSNGLRIQTIIETCNRIGAHYFEADANGAPIYDPTYKEVTKADGETERVLSGHEPRLQPGKALADYDKEIQQHLSKEVGVGLHLI